MSLIVLIQIVMTHFGGVVLRSFGLNANEWLFVVVLALSVVPFDIARKLILKLFSKEEDTATKNV